MWIIPSFLLDWKRDIRPHIILKADIIEQLVQFCYAENEPVVIIESLQDCVGTNGVVCSFHTVTGYMELLMHKLGLPSRLN
jgi:hypothetical protein